MLKNFNLNKTNLFFTLLGMKTIFELAIFFKLISKANTTPFVHNMGSWFCGENIFIGIVNFIIMACVIIILRQFFINEIDKSLILWVKRSSYVDLMLLFVGPLLGIISLVGHKVELYYAFIRILIEAVGVAVFYVMLSAIALILYKYVVKRFFE